MDVKLGVININPLYDIRSLTIKNKKVGKVLKISRSTDLTNYVYQDTIVAEVMP